MIRGSHDLTRSGPEDRFDLRGVLRSGGVRFAWFSLGSLPLLEIGARQGFNAVIIDLQHGLWDRMSAHLAVSATGAVPVIMRVATNSASAIGEALDSGADGVLVPLIETAEQAQAAVRATNFPTQGVRSAGGVRPLAEGFASYWKYNATPLVGIMIETVKGVHNAAAIAAVAGIDFVFIGTGDLALSLGCFPEIDQRHEQACSTVLQVCRSAQVPCGIFTGSAMLAEQRLLQGYAAVVGASDVDVAVAGFSNALPHAQRTPPRAPVPRSDE